MARAVFLADVTIPLRMEEESRAEFINGVRKIYKGVKSSAEGELFFGDRRLPYSLAGKGWHAHQLRVEIHFSTLDLDDVQVIRPLEGALKLSELFGFMLEPLGDHSSTYVITFKE